MSKWTDIKAELDTDPLGRGYAGMTDAQAAADMNTAYRNTTVAITVSEFENAARESGKFVQLIDRSELKEPDGSRTFESAYALMSSLVGRTTEMDFAEVGSYWYNVLEDCVAEGSLGTGAATAIRALCDEIITRGVELGVGTVEEGDVNYARSLDTQTAGASGVVPPGQTRGGPRGR